MRNAKINNSTILNVLLFGAASALITAYVLQPIWNTVTKPL